MNEADTLIRILQRDQVVAIVGLSNRADRPSHEVAAYLQRHGYRIVPINPAYAQPPNEILGERCYPTLGEAAAALARDGIAIGLVDVFRRSEEVVPIAREAVAIGAKSLWLQIGVVNQEAIDLAAAAGLDVIMDRCTKIEHARLVAAGARTVGSS